MTNPDEVKPKIMERGYWKIALQPTEYVKDRLDHENLEKLLKKHKVCLRGWSYPHVPATQVHQGFYTVENATEAWVHYEEHLEIFRFYQSGQFIHYMGMIEDRQGDHPPLFVEWTPKMQKKQPDQIFLDPICTLYTLTEIMLFASKLATENLFGDEIVVSIELHNMRDRILKSLDIQRAVFHDEKCHSKAIKLGPKTYSSDSLNIEHDKLAVDWTIEILSQFNFRSEHNKKVLENDQIRFYNRDF